MADSVFPWPESWWTNFGRRDGNDWVMPAGATFVPWANQAVPVRSKKWTIEFQYDLSEATVVAIRQNPFSKADENSQVGQIPLRTITLQPGTNATRTVNVSLGKSDQPLWTPSFQFSSGGEVRFHSIKMYETPVEPPAPAVPAESLLPALGSWWRSRGQLRGDGAYINAGASTTPYDNAAIPAGDRRFTFEMVYTSGDPNLVNVRVNRFDDKNRKIDGPFLVKDVPLASGKESTVKVDVELPIDPRPRWLPSLLVDPSGHDILIHSLKVYATPRQAQPISIWDGEAEQECAITLWDGASEIDASIDFVN